MYFFKVKKRVSIVLSTLKYLSEACGVDQFVSYYIIVIDKEWISSLFIYFKKEKLQEMMMQFYRIYSSSPLELYLAAFDDSEYFETLIKLLENLLSQEKNIKKLPIALSTDKTKEEGINEFII